MSLELFYQLRNNQSQQKNYLAEMTPQKFSAISDELDAIFKQQITGQSNNNNNTEEEPVEKNIGVEYNNQRIKIKDAEIKKTFNTDSSEIRTSSDQHDGASVLPSGQNASDAGYTEQTQSYSRNQNGQEATKTVSKKYQEKDIYRIIE